MNAEGQTREVMTSISLALSLRDAGLVWHPEEADFFHIPDRGFGDRVFSISTMVVEVREVLGDRELAFNGTVEWALDSILKADVVWIPTEGQLRQLLGGKFVALYREDDGRQTCVARHDGLPTTFTAETAADAYGSALLAILSR